MFSAIGIDVVWQNLSCSSEQIMMLARGTVLWFSKDKGYGFIRTTKGEEVFVHFSSIQQEGFRVLKTGDAVEFELRAGPKGKLAQNVRKVG